MLEAIDESSSLCFLSAEGPLCFFPGLGRDATANLEATNARLAVSVSAQNMRGDEKSFEYPSWGMKGGQVAWMQYCGSTWDP